MKQRQRNKQNLLPFISASLASSFLLFNSLPAQANTLGTLSIPSSDLPAGMRGDIDAAIDAAILKGAAMRHDMVASRTVKFMKGDTLAKVLTREGVDKAQRDAALKALGAHFDVSKLKAGDKVDVAMRGSEPSKRNLVALRLHAGKAQEVAIVSGADGAFSMQGKAPAAENPAIEKAVAVSTESWPVAAAALTLGSPVRTGRMTSPWGWRIHPVLGVRKFHKGVDYAAPKGTPVYATDDGEVQTIGWRGNYGRYIKLTHNEHLATAYAHLSRFAAGLKPGAHVRKGQVIAYIGASGLATGNHLYYEVIVDNKRVNPLQNIVVQTNLDGSKQVELEPYATQLSENVRR
ncbi:peptidoglycan DD-metalloendopeptidase family protein [Parvibaculum sedimenti]|uniref:Peptidoglycan DD-metalloendopeptidase family protein n=1 Tax=Parvibaculum sedimenti TaxID=2608632 RepID=A0A6N6VK87_9HYPH|nr:M23 family metallopeptidase [Parvibaculum sedimenti]KAB7739707.1 peptidoglycan DD-metalloendopeptidase family protein [Parvibaculum sedimenti]